MKRFQIKLLSVQIQIQITWKEAVSEEEVPGDVFGRWNRNCNTQVNT